CPDLGRPQDLSLPTLSRTEAGVKDGQQVAGGTTEIGPVIHETEGDQFGMGPGVPRDVVGNDSRFKRLDIEANPARDRGTGCLPVHTHSTHPHECKNEKSRDGPAPTGATSRGATTLSLAGKVGYGAWESKQETHGRSGVTTRRSPK